MATVPPGGTILGQKPLHATDRTAHSEERLRHEGGAASRVQEADDEPHRIELRLNHGSSVGLDGILRLGQERSPSRDQGLLSDARLVAAGLRLFACDLEGRLRVPHVLLGCREGLPREDRP